MRLIEKLPTEYVTTKNGKIRNKTLGMFLCPSCKELVKKEVHNGLKYVSCGAKECQPPKTYRKDCSENRMYNAWANMKQRCDNPKNTAYKAYGAKGIKYCERWKDFKNFEEDMYIQNIKDLTLDRIDNTKGYYKDNCQWIKRSENISKDKTKEIIKLDLEGNELARYTSAKEAAEKEGIKYPAAITRVARGERKAYKGYVWMYAL
jgi:uncharacterized protein YlaI